MSLARRGVPKSPEHRAAIAAANRRRYADPSLREAISKRMKGRSVSVATRARIAATLRGRSLSPSHRMAVIAALKGRVRSASHQARMAEAMRKRRLTPEHRAALSRAHTGKPLTPAHQAKLAAMVRTPEFRQRMSAAVARLWQDEAYRQRGIRVAEARMRVMSLEARQRLTAAGRAKSAAMWRGTTIELMVRAFLEEIPGLVFFWQKWIGAFVVDFYLPAQSLVVECDGDYWHSRPGAAAHDRQRDEWLTTHGYRVVRLSESRIRRKDFGPLLDALSIN